MITIKRNSDDRVVKCILHRVADIPGGVSIKASTLGGSVLKEGTPLGRSSSDGLYRVTKTAKVVTEAADDAVTYEVEKGHHFKVGDYFATEDANGQQITAIDKTTNTDKDVITVGTTLGAVIAVDTVAFQSSASNKTVAYPPTVIAGSSHTVETDSNLFVDAWVIAVVSAGNAPYVNDTLKGTLKGIHYIV